jgi:ATP-dependent DNA helicase RecG
MGVSVVRNPLIVSFISKGILPYRGLGSGIRRTLEITDNIEFIDDREGCTFTVRVFTEKQFTRKRQSEYESVNYQNEPVNYRSEPINYQNGPGNYNREPESDQNEPINHENEPINHQCDPGNTETVTSKILTFLIKEPEISYDELALQIGKSRSTVKRWLQELRERGVIVRQGARKKGFWVVIGNGEK